MAGSSRPHSPQPITGYNEVDVTLEHFCQLLQETLGSNLYGLYLYGSLATGDFHPLSSDIDFVAVTQTSLTRHDISRLRKLHLTLFKTGTTWDKRLEGSYIPLADMPRYRAGDGPYPSINEGKFSLTKPGSQWILHRHVLAHHGVTVYGPSIKDLIEPLHEQDLRRAQAQVLREKWLPRLHNDHFFESADDTAYAVLTMARALFLFERGQVGTKVEAAHWAYEHIESKWHAIIQTALESRGTAAFHDIAHTKDFISWTLDQSSAYV